MDASNLKITERGTVRIISINRPERRNAVDFETAEQLHDAFKKFDKADDFNIAILTGEGGNFCAGADLKSVGTEDFPSRVQPGGVDTFAPMGVSRMQLSKPVIGAIEGYAVAGGMELAMWCDLRVMSNDAAMGIFCRRFGVPLIDMGTVRLPRLIGQSRAMDLILTGREVGAEEAFQIGLANRLCESGKALKTAIELAENISKFPQSCLRNDRTSLLEQWSLSPNQAIEAETALGRQTLSSGETLAGAARFSSGEGRHGGFKKD